MRIPLRRYWRLLASYLLPQWRRVALLGALLLATIGMELINWTGLEHAVSPKS